MPRKTIKAIPIRTPAGPVSWQGIAAWLDSFQREVLAQFDIRNPQAFPDGIVADPVTGDVTLGNQAIPDGRSAGIPALVSRIANTGKAVDQRFLPSVSVVNWLSAQSANPVTSSSTASESTVNVAAHTVRYGAGTISYSAGSITGLDTDTTYYVYASDPNLDGGAMAYTATTDPLEVVGGNDRVRIGSIRTAISATTGNVTAISQANPGEVTMASAHGWTSGDQVTFSGVVGMTEVNGNTYTITVTSPTEFTIGVNTTAFTAYVSDGTAARVSTETGGGGGWPWFGENEYIQ